MPRPKRGTKRRQRAKARDLKAELPSSKDVEPDWDGKCEVCGASPTVPVTGMCGPCTFGEAETVGGNW